MVFPTNFLLLDSSALILSRVLRIRIINCTLLVAELTEDELYRRKRKELLRHEQTTFLFFVSNNNTF